MGGSSSSRHISVESEDAEGVVFVKGIRLTGRVIDRLREPPPVQHSQTKSSKCPQVDQLLAHQSETFTPTELLAPKLSQPPSYASALVPPHLQESVSPFVPLVSVSQETPTSHKSTPTVPSDTHTAPESAPAPVPSVQEHVISMSPESVPQALPAEPSPVTTSPLSVTEPVAMPLPAEPVPVVLSHSAEAVDISPPLIPITDTMPSPSPSEPIATPVEAPTMLLTNDVLTAPPVEAIHMPPNVDTGSIHVESSVPSTPTLTLDATISVEQLEQPTTPTSEPVAKIELPLLPFTLFTSPTESVEIPTDIPPAPVKSSDLSSNLEELLPTPPTSALAVTCEGSSVGQIGHPSNQHASAPVDPAIAPVLPPLTETVDPRCSPQAVVNEEDLRKQIRDELQKLLQEEIKMAKQKIHKQLEEEKAKAEAEAQAKAQQQIQKDVQKILEKEQLTLQQTLKDVIIQERKKIQHEQLASQYYWMERKKQIQKLGEKERDLAKQDSMYNEQIAKLEEKTAKLTRITAESFKKGLEETQKRFKSYQIKPVCSELQSEILKCYLQNTGQTLTCSNIASQYVKCVNNVKQNKKVSTGG